MTTQVPKGRTKDGKINVSLNPETVEMLVLVKDVPFAVEPVDSLMCLWEIT